MLAARAKGQRRFLQACVFLSEKKNYSSFSPKRKQVNKRRRLQVVKQKTTGALLCRVHAATWELDLKSGPNGTNRTFQSDEDSARCK